MKRVLLVAYFYPPLAGGGVHRVLSWTRYLPAHGWACTVVCAGPEDHWVRDPSLLAVVPADTEVIRVRGGSGPAAWLRVFRRGGGGADRRPGGALAPLRRVANWVAIPDTYVGWAVRARAAAGRRLAAGGVDALLSSSPPDSAHLAAAPLAARFRLPWVADFRDPWAGFAFRTPPTRWHRARHEALHRGVLTGADLVLAASRTHADQLAAGASPPRRLEHLPNGFEPGPPAAAAVDPDHFRIALTGTWWMLDDLGTLFEALHELLARHPDGRRRVRLELAGAYDTDWEDRARALGLTGIVRFTGARAHAEARALQRAADLLVLLRPNLRTMVPGKLYEYLDAGRPLHALLPAGDEAEALVRRAGGGITPPGDREALARALETRYTAWRDGGRAPDARPAWVDEFQRARLAARLAQLLDGLSGGTA